MINMKELLLSGCRVSHAYKTNEKEWVGEARIHIFSGYFSKPKVIVEGDLKRTEYSLDEIDKAIEDYSNAVFNEKNLWYKMNETLCELHSKGIYYDLDDDEQREKVNSRRLEIIKESKQV